MLYTMINVILCAIIYYSSNCSLIVLCITVKQLNYLLLFIAPAIALLVSLDLFVMIFTCAHLLNNLSLSCVLPVTMQLYIVLVIYTVIPQILHFDLSTKFYMNFQKSMKIFAQIRDMLEYEVLYFKILVFCDVPMIFSSSYIHVFNTRCLSLYQSVYLFKKIVKNISHEKKMNFFLLY